MRNGQKYYGKIEFTEKGLHSRNPPYHKPGSKTAAVNEKPQGLNFAVLPDADGNLKAYAVYSMAF